MGWGATQSVAVRRAGGRGRSPPHSSRKSHLRERHFVLTARPCALYSDPRRPFTEQKSGATEDRAAGLGERSPSVGIPSASGHETQSPDTWPAVQRRLREHISNKKTPATSKGCQSCVEKCQLIGPQHHPRGIAQGCGHTGLVGWGGERAPAQGGHLGPGGGGLTPASRAHAGPLPLGPAITHPGPWEAPLSWGSAPPRDTLQGCQPAELQHRPPGRVDLRSALPCTLGLSSPGSSLVKTAGPQQEAQGLGSCLLGDRMEGLPQGLTHSPEHPEPRAPRTQ